MLLFYHSKNFSYVQPHRQKRKISFRCCHVVTASFVTLGLKEQFVATFVSPRSKHWALVGQPVESGMSLQKSRRNVRPMNSMVTIPPHDLRERRLSVRSVKLVQCHHRDIGSTPVVYSENRISLDGAVRIPLRRRSR